MVHLVEGSQADDRWTGAEPQSRPVVVGLVLVAITGVVVVLAHEVAAGFRSDMAIVWAVLGLAMASGLRHWLRGRRHGRAAESRQDTPLVLRRDGTNVQVDARRHRRFVPARRATTLYLRDGRRVSARIVDISIAGVAIEARISEVDFMAVDRVGSRPAGPVRRTPNGAVFGFSTLLDPQPFDASFVL